MTNLSKDLRMPSFAGREAGTQRPAPKAEPPALPLHPGAGEEPRRRLRHLDRDPQKSLPAPGRGQRELEGGDPRLAGAGLRAEGRVHQRRGRVGGAAGDGRLEFGVYDLRLYQFN